MSTITIDKFFKGQINLIGKDQFDLLRKSKVLVVGAGGLGCPAIHYMALSGIGSIGVVDHDLVSLSNLHRQTFYKIQDIGLPKVQVLKNFLEQYSPYTDIIIYQDQLVHENAKDIIQNYDIVLDCTDNFTTKFLIHDTCYHLNKKLVQASVYQTEGQLSVFDFKDSSDHLCLRCLWEKQPEDGCTGTCAEVGVMPPLVGVLGNMQAMESLNILLGISTLKSGQTLFVDLRYQNYDIRTWKKNANCLLLTNKLESKNQPNEIPTPKNLSDYILIDVRSSEEFSNCNIVTQFDYLNILNIPLDLIHQLNLDQSKKYLFFCSKGIRSKKAIQMLSLKYDISHVFSLRGGVNSLLHYI